MSVSRFSQLSLQNGFEKFPNLWDGFTAVGSMDAITSVTLSSGMTSVSFNNIPQTYQHLHIRGSVIGSTANGDINVRLNGDTGTNYSWHELRGNGAAPTSSSSITTSSLYISSNALDASYPESFIFDLFDYSNTNKFKTSRSMRGGDRNGSGTLGGFSGNWRNTAAVNNIYIFSGTMSANSVISLYGIK